MQTRRQFIRAAAVCVMFPMGISPTLAEQFNNHAAKEADAIARMKMANYRDIILVNKGNGHLIVVEDGERRLTTPVIIGKGNTPTPTGIFSLQNLANGSSYPKMVFHHDDRVAYLIHDVIAGREQAILKDDPRLRQLSAGCINISQPFLDMVMGYARHQGEKTSKAIPFVILPERYSSSLLEKQISKFQPEDYHTK